MDKALQEYYEARFDMMSTQGWKDFIEDVEKIVEVYDRISEIKDTEDLWKRKGQLDILNWVLNLKRESEVAWEELNGS
jgi:hypothetical protein